MKGGVYETYVKNTKKKTGLTIDVEKEQFVLNGKPIILMGGAIHYFRVPREYWQDRLKKIRALGLNCIDVYVPWNLHEPMEGTYDFGDGETTFSKMLNIKAFLELAQKEDLLVVFRPGPYICAELDFGGLPSWLLRKEQINVRTSDPKYLEPALTYLKMLYRLVSSMTIRNGGPIVAVQIENEYGNFGYGDYPRDKIYLKELHSLAKRFFNKEDVLFITSDTPSIGKDHGTIPNVLQTANAQINVEKELHLLNEYGINNQPKMVMEFWSGWFDHWLEKYHNKWNIQEFLLNLNKLLDMKASFSFYMCHGGTNFAFTAGANTEESAYPFYLPDVTSYDYDCLIGEYGNLTKKYEAARPLIERVQRECNDVMSPNVPTYMPTTSYGAVKFTNILDFNGILCNMTPVKSDTVLSMEDLPINQNNGQTFGYIVYRKVMETCAEYTLKIEGHVRDMLCVLIDEEQVSPSILKASDLKKLGTWTTRNSEFKIKANKVPHTLSLLVENCGRVNYGKPHEFKVKKGISEGSVLIDNKEVTEWHIFPMEMKENWINRLSGFKPYNGERLEGPAILSGHIDLKEEPSNDTFMDATSWGKGSAYVNGFNIGRFWSGGPQKTLYVPAPLLRKGKNTIIIFVQYKGKGDDVLLTDKHSLGEPSPTESTPGSGGPLLVMDY